MRRVLVLVVIAGLLVGATAVAQEGGSQGPYELQEPTVDSAQVLQLPPDAACAAFTLVTIRILPPAGAVFGELRVNLDGVLQTRLTGVPRAASVTLRIGRGRTDVAVTGTTLGGQVVRAVRSYRRCRPTPAPRRAAPQPAPQPAPLPEGDIVGGGEDG